MTVAIAGCYTLLKHPRFATEDLDSETANSAPVTYADDCASCHESGSYLDAHGYGPPPSSAYDRWYYYYEYPWWIPYYAPRPGDGDNAAGEQQQRPFGRRHRSADHEGQPSQTAVTGSGAAQSPAIISKSGDELKKEEPKPAEKEDKRGDRRDGDTDSDKRRDRKP